VIYGCTAVYHYTGVGKRYLPAFLLLTAVRFGRVPKREKARILAAMQQSTNSRSQEKAVTAELEDEQRLLSTVIRAHLDTCDFTRDKVEPMLTRARDQPSYTACPPTLVSLSSLTVRDELN
jgi:nuclear receptor subfamily 1 group D protein 3